MVRRIKAKLVLQLRSQGLSGRAIAAGQGMSRHSVQAVIDAAEEAVHIALGESRCSVVG